MKIGTILGIAAVALTALAANAQQATTAYTVAYAEVAPSPSAERDAIAVFKTYRDAARKEPGNLRADVLQETGRAGHFLVIEEWKDVDALNAHRTSPARKEFESKLDAIRIAPYDERVNRPLAVGLEMNSPGSDAIYVVTHLDTIPTNMSHSLELLQGLAAKCRAEDGNVEFDILQGARPNHFTILEAWRNQKALDKHAEAASTKQWREEAHGLAPDASPYDERVYHLVK